MKVLHLASGDGWGGAEQSLVRLLEAVRARPRIDCTAVLLNEGPLARRLRAAGVEVRVLDEGSKGARALVREVRGLFREGGFEIVHAHRYKEILLGLLVVLPRSGRLVATVHGLEPLGQLTLRQASRVWGSLAAASLARARLVAVSAELVRRIRRALPGANVRRIPNPLAPAAPAHDGGLRRSCGWPEDLPVVGFVGRLEAVKGPDRLLDAAARMEGDIGFVFVGDGSLRAELEERVRQLARPERFHLLGAVDDAQPVLAQCDVLALPSRHEGIPMVLLEAAALRRPVVAFDVGGVAEVLGGGAPATALVPDGDCGAFAAALERVLAGVPRADVERWASAVEREFSRDVVLEAYEAVYREATGG